MSEDIITLDNDNGSDFTPPEERPKTIKINDQDVPSEQTSLTLNQEERDYFSNALRIGFWEKTGYVFGHKVIARTLTVDEELQVSEIVSPHQGTTGFARLWTTAQVAAAVQEIDGEPLFIPITPEDREKLVARKFEKLKSYFPAFIDQVFVDIVKELESEVAQKLRDKLGK